MLHELVEKEKAAARNVAHALRERLDRFIPTRHARPEEPAAPAATPSESPPPRVEAAPDTKPPAV